MSKGYLVISADCHAGPDSPVYREFLDPEFREQFDDELGARDALMQQMRRERFGTDDDVFAGSEAFQEEWFGEDEDGNSLHEIGMRGGWDAKKRDEELSADGVTGEVVFPGPDAVTARWARRSVRGSPSTAPPIPCSYLPVRARTTAGPPSSAARAPNDAPV